MLTKALLDQTSNRFDVATCAQDGFRALHSVNTCSHERDIVTFKVDIVRFV